MAHFRKPIKKEKKFFSHKDVESLTVSDKMIGEGAFGRVFEGVLKFKGQKAIKVAVKKFKSVDFEEGTGLEIGERQVEFFRNLIRKLSEVGIKVPKMDFVKANGEYVLVSELFSSKGESKLWEGHYHYEKFDYLSEKVQNQLMNDLGKLAGKVESLGHILFFDMVGFFHGNNKIELLIHDIDNFIYNEFKFDSSNPRTVRKANNRLKDLVDKALIAAVLTDSRKQELRKIFSDALGRNPWSE